LESATTETDAVTSDRCPIPSYAGESNDDMSAATNKTILIVDDDAEIVESIRVLLESRGFRVLVERDGNAGLTMAERESPDLIVLDMMMPKKSGFLVLEKLRTRPGGMIPTIMITSNEGSRHRAYAEFLGVKDYIRKPFALDKLVRSIEKCLNLDGITRDEDLD
jgi:DNA-binding response OmpR family regulator